MHLTGKISLKVETSVIIVYYLGLCLIFDVQIDILKILKTR